MIKREAFLSMFKSLLNLVPIAIIWLSAWSIYLASLAVNHSLREGGGVPSTPAALLISTSKIYGPYLAALLFTVLLIACRVRYPKYLRIIQAGSLSVMLLYASFALLAVMTLFICMCNAWQQW